MLWTVYHKNDVLMLIADTDLEARVMAHGLTGMALSEISVVPTSLDLKTLRNNKNIITQTTETFPALND